MGCWEESVARTQDTRILIPDLFLTHWGMQASHTTS